MSTLCLVLAVCAQQSVRITSVTAPVRSDPRKSANVIGEAMRGAIYVRVDSQGDWRKIWYNFRTGWIYKGHLDGANAPAVMVTQSVNVRRGPGAGYQIVGTAPAASWWAIVGKSGEWRRIWWRSSERWIHENSISRPQTGQGAGLAESSRGFVQLPGSGAGFYSSTTDGRRWGRPALVYGLMRAASMWKYAHDWPRIGIGDISYRNGGPMEPHVSHQVGEDADIRPVRKYGEGPVTIYDGAYSHTRTRDWITRHVHRELRIDMILFNDPDIARDLGYVQTYPNHHHHMHVRIR